MPTSVALGSHFEDSVRKLLAFGRFNGSEIVRAGLVVIAADESRRLATVTGKALIAATQASPHRDVNLEPEREPTLVRNVSL